MTVIRTSMQGETLHLIGRYDNKVNAVLPAWMTEPAAKAITPVKYPRLLFANLQEVRRLLDARVASESSIVRREAADDNISQDTNGTVRNGGRARRADTKICQGGVADAAGHYASRGRTKSVDDAAGKGGKR